MKLYHLLHAEYGLAAIRDRRFKLSTFDTLNDPFELFASDLRDPAIRKLYRDVKEDMTKKMAILCCSKSVSNTLLWSHYADRHRGMALELEVADEDVTHVRYSEHRVPVTQAMLDAMQPDVPSELGEYLSIKAADWAYEDEARIKFMIDHIKERPANGLHFMPFTARIQLRGVVLGSLCETSVGAIGRALNPGQQIGVRRVRIAFGSFRVVEDQSFRPRWLTRAADEPGAPTP